MTEITVQKKKTSIWPWLILGLIVLAVILYFVLRNNDKNDTAITNTDTTAMAINTAQQNNDAVAAYIAFVKQGGDQMSADHNYSSTALTKLADAVQAKADAAGYDAKTDLDKVRADADYITKNPEATDHADKIKDAAGAVSNSLQHLQQAKYPALSNEANDVQNAASAIHPNVLTLNQKDAIQSFFDKAADMLQKMQ